MSKRSHNNNSSVSDLTKTAENIGNQSDLIDSPEVLEEPSIEKPEIVFIEPFYSGSHKQLIDLLKNQFPSSRLVTLTGKKWPWRARCSALILSTLIPAVTSEKVLFTSSVLSLAELVGIRPDLQKLKKVVYFHENQFVYPIREIKERDVQFAYNQITTCLAADLVVFNSHFNRESFFANFNKIIKLLPDYRPKGIIELIRPKTRVLYFPLDFAQLNPGFSKTNKQVKSNCLQICWPHRWEFDKSPHTFIDILLKLKANKCEFQVHLLGGNFADVADKFQEARTLLEENIATFGFLDSKSDYYECLQSCHVVVSTAIHEFFGVAMLEATFCGCFPLVPDRLSYKELYPAMCRYQEDEECLQKLSDYCKEPEKARKDRQKLESDFDWYKFNIDKLMPLYKELFKG